MGNVHLDGHKFREVVHIKDIRLGIGDKLTIQVSFAAILNEKVLISFKVDNLFSAFIDHSEVFGLGTPSKLQYLKLLKTLGAESCMPIGGCLLACREKLFTGNGGCLGRKDIKGDAGENGELFGMVLVAM